MLGNHDLDSLSKEDFLKIVGNTGISQYSSYYSFDLKGLHFIGFRLSQSKKQDLGFDATTFPNHRAVEKFPYRRSLWRRIISLHRKLSSKPTIFQYRDAIPHFLGNGNSEASIPYYRQVRQVISDKGRLLRRQTDPFE